MKELVQFEIISVKTQFFEYQHPNTSWKIKAAEMRENTEVHFVRVDQKGVLNACDV